MFVATLLCAPGANTLSHDLMLSLRNALGGGEITWLAEREAAEFTLPEYPAHLDSLREELHPLQTDILIQPEQGRRKRLLMADMDSTMIGQECIDELGEAAGAGEAIRAVTKRAMDGELDFSQSLHARVALLEGLEETVIAEVLASRITHTTGGLALVSTMKANGAASALVSGGFTAFAEPVGAALGFDHVRANRLEVSDGKLTGKVIPPVLGRDAKAQEMQRLCATYDLEPQDVLAVGDGANDLAMLAMAGSGVALHAKPAVAAACDLQVNFGDLTALLYLQGIPRDAFVATV